MGRSGADPALARPVIKWAGSKRRVAARLHALWPTGAHRYVEPFLGGGAMLPGRPARPALAGDVLPELIDLWTAVRDRPADVVDHYRAAFLDRRARGGVVYDEVRDRFNRERAGLDLLVLTRWCVNGLVRFNRAGDFNNSLHHTRPGVDPDRLAATVAAWSAALADVELRCADFRATLADARPGDVVFLDPPYRHTRGRYLPGGLDPDVLFAELERLNGLGVPWILAFDGRAGDRAYEHGVPRELWRARIGLPTGHSPFPRLMRTGLDPVEESAFLSFEPPPLS
jgi:DNA adenine methylase